MDLKTRAIKSAAWYAGTRLWQQGLSWAVTIVLARLLTPADYGLFGMAFAVIAFLELFQQFGLGTAIIQRQDLSQPQLNAIFWIVSTASLVVTLLAFSGAGWVAAFYGEPRLTWITRALAVIFLLDALGMVPYTLLTKEIDFRRRSLAEASGVVASAAVSVLLAYWGYGVWALVGGQLVRAAVRNATMALFCQWMPTFDVSFHGMAAVMTFGVRVAGATVFRGLSSLTQTAIIGRFLGGSALGLYSMATSIGTNPFHKLSTAVINQLSLPVFAKLQHQDEQLRGYFLKITKYLAVVALPMQLGLALVAHDLVLVLLSEKWQGVVPLLQVFSIGGVWYVLALPATPVLTARGKARTTLRFSGLSFVLMTGAYLVGVRFGLIGVAWAWALSYCSLRTALLGLSLAELKLPIRTYLENISLPFISALAMAATIVLVRSALPAASVDGAVERLARDALVGAMTYIPMLMLVDRAFGSELKSIAQSLFATSRA